MKRRNFLRNVSLAGVGLALQSQNSQKNPKQNTMKKNTSPSLPVVIGTWKVKNATEKAWNVLKSGKSSLDAVEMGCRVEESNIKNKTVGLGGLPDRDGNVTLDASIMNRNGNCGSVVYLHNIVHAVSVARKVMEETPHVMLAGKGAELFAYEQGFEKKNLLTEEATKEWKEWKKESNYEPVINIENHDTIGMLAIDNNGDIAGACTTSGLAYKMNGRVGDSPIIGSGLYVDNEVGGAVATGMGEEVIKTVGSFLIVELMRQGKSPQEACEEAINRIISKPGSNYKNFQVAYIAVNKNGETGSYAIHENFTMSKYQNDTNEIIKSDFVLEKEEK